ncbi:type I secretion target repeat protein [Roseobacter sp. AzwK-3b]|uniref:Hint domain-containing protein n=1 Tax=Roseobacter sp. AzwK-3b TaxID=351016 RepID=UPI0001569A8F|nr:Hint domain-containing protein [Roseobacter sp. AzwK-3b]EDM72427.1 type I secretion target repeat protein [Roseobacter sp. AzwK-3b]
MAQILGRVVDDTNLDFTENNGSGGFDTGIPGIQVTLLDRFGTVLQTTFTDANGNYIFTGVDVGEYRIQIPQELGDRTLADKNVGGDFRSDSDANSNGLTDVLVISDINQSLEEVDFIYGVYPDQVVDGTNDGDLIAVGQFTDSDSDVVTAGNDTILGNGGDDQIFASDGNDLAEGGTGQDFVAGEGGNDTLFGDNSDGRVGEGLPNLIVNGSFEDTTGLTAESFGFTGAGAVPGWTSIDPTDTLEVYNVNSEAVNAGGTVASDGSNALDMGESPGNIGIFQDVPNLLAGEIYRLSFDLYDSPSLPNTGSGSNAIEVFFGGQSVGVFNPENNAQWQTFSANLVGGSGNGSDRLEFRGLGPEDDIGVGLDNIMLQPFSAPAIDAALEATSNDGLDGGAGEDLLVGGVGGDNIVGGDGNDTIFGDNGDSGTRVFGFETPPNLIYNGSFENFDGLRQTPTGFAGDGAIAGWITVEPNQAIEIFNFNQETPVTGSDGDFALDMGASPGNITIFQDVQNLVAGETYRLSFDLSDSANLVDTGPGSNEIEVFFGNQSLGVFNPDNGVGFQSFSVDVVAGAGDGSDRLQFVGLGTEDNIGVGLDNVQLVPTSEAGLEAALTANAGNDTITSGTGDDLVYGNAGDDLIYGGDGNDTLRGREDNDTLNGDAGNDNILGEDGDDLISGGTGVDFLSGDAGNDTIVAASAADGAGDSVFGGAEGALDNDVLDLRGAGPVTITQEADPNDAGATRGTVTFGDGSTLTFEGIETILRDPDGVVDGADTSQAMPVGFTDAQGDVITENADTIFGNGGDDTISSGGGDDFVAGGIGNDVIDGGLGNDNLNGDDGNDSLSGDAGNDQLFGGSGFDALSGGDGDDLLAGGLDNDTLFGDAGNDDLRGEDGDDFLSGGIGDDFLEGGTGNDNVNGDDGNDDLRGEAGDDQLFGGAGIDTLFGGDGNDLLAGGFDNDVLLGDAGNDDLRGEDGDDFLSGGIGDDFLEGGNGNDTLNGDEGNDDLRGEAGDDQLFGGDGNDTLAGGTGADSLVGGAGEDSFVLGADDTAGGGDGDDLFLVDPTLPTGGDATIVGGETGETNGDTLDLRGVGPVTLVYDTTDPTFDPATGTSESGRATYTNTAGDPVTINFSEIETVLTDPDGVVDGTPSGDNIPVGFTDAQGDQVTDGADTILAGAGNDTIAAGGGDDSVDAGTGDDFVDAGAGADSVDGGDGNDDLRGGTDNDTILGGAGDDFIDGDAGDDQIFAGDGNDDLRGSEGEDFIDGGAGNDNILGEEDNDDLRGGDDVDMLFGGTGDDFLDGDAGDDMVFGGDGNDDMRGSEGNDLLDGGAGNDTLLGEEGSDTLTGGEGADSLDGGLGDDNLVVGAGDIATGGDGDDVFTVDPMLTGSDPITVVGGETGEDLTDPTNGGAGDVLDLTGLDVVSVTYDNTDPTFDPVTGVGESGTVVFNNDAGDPVTLNFSEIETVIFDPLADGVVDGTAGDDALPIGFTDAQGDQIDGADGDNDVIDAGAGNDSVAAGLGDDTVTAGTGDDVVDGGAGNDVISGDAGNDDLAGAAGNDQISGGTGDDFIVGELGDDSLFGDEGNDILFGGDGNDSLEGGDGADSLAGNAGADTLLGGDGDDVIAVGGRDVATGGAGDDVFIFDTTDPEPNVQATIDGGSDATDGAPGGPENGDAGDILDLSAVTGPLDVVFDPNPESGAVDGLDGDVFPDLAFSEIEQVITGAGNDTLDASTSTGPVDIEAGAGDDSVTAGAGNDSVLGDAGNDVLDGGAGNDTLDGGADNDAVTGGAGDDSLLGGDGSDTLAGGEGNDTLDGGAGDDDIAVGGGDSAVGGAGDDVFRLDPTDTNPNTQITIDGGTDGTDGAPGGPENGDAGDILDLSDATGPLDVVFGTNPETGIVNGVDGDVFPDVSFSEIEQVVTGAGNDTLDASTSNGPINVATGAGDDEVLGGAGNDVIDAGDGADSVDGGAGDDTIGAGLGNDTVNAGDGADDVLGGAGEDVLDGGAGNDTLDGGDDNDSLTGGAGDDSLLGGAGEDTLAGGEGADVLDGGLGNDALEVGAGDTAAGDAGDDVFTVDRALTGADPITITGGETGETNGDTLDLSGNGPVTLDFDTTDPTFDPVTGRSESGTATFTNDNGDLVTVTFSEIENVIPCFTPGTVIATPRGERLVQDLQVGDRIITRDNGIQEIRWIGRRDLQGRELLQAPHLKPVLIRAGSLGYGLPERDMVVSPNHRVLINNERTALYFEDREVLAAAKHLTGLDGVDLVDASSVSYIHFMFDQHEVVLSDGAWTESFQPGEQTMDGMGQAQRDEIYELFPELRDADGLKAYQAARRSLKKYEAKLLLS